eukprot:gene32428-39213_t
MMRPPVLFFGAWRSISPEDRLYNTVDPTLKRGTRRRASIDDLVVNLPAYERVHKWLSSNSDAEITWVSRRKDYIKVTASIGTWERVLNTHFYLYEDRSRRQTDDGPGKFMHGSTEYSIPAYLEHDIAAVFHTVQTPPVFHSRYRTVKANKFSQRFKTNLRVRKDGQISTMNSDVDPAFLNSYYQIESNIGSAQLNQSVFETGDEYFSPSDLTQFQNKYGLTEQSAISIGGHSTSQSCNTGNIDCSEGNLDIQYIMGIAQVTFSIYWYVAETQTQDPFVAWITDVADEENPPQSNSISWGSNEFANSASTMNSFDDEASLLAIRGVTITVSSGDDGAPNEDQDLGCLCQFTSSSSQSDWKGSNSWSGRGYFPSFPATSPWVTAVGATMGPNTGDPEIACQSQLGGLITTGGGFSTYYPVPSWQEETTSYYFSHLSAGETPTSGYNSQGRGYPDISLIGVEYQVIIDGDPYSLYGTSASSPVIAAFVSLVNAARIRNNLSAIGFLNPTLYAVGLNNTLGLGNVYNASFNDVTSGHNRCCSYSNINNPSGATCCASGFYTTAGWDPVTGWGSVFYRDFAAIFDVAAPYTRDDDDGSSSDGLTDGEVAGVVVGVLAAAALISFGVYSVVGAGAVSAPLAAQSATTGVVIAQPVTHAAPVTQASYVQQPVGNRI